MADGILPLPKSGVSEHVAGGGRAQAFGLGEPGTRTLYLPAGTTAVEFFAVPDLLARAVNADAPPAMRDETVLLAEAFEHRLRDALRDGRVVALAWDSREPMPGTSAWAVLVKAAIMTREQFCLFAGLCGVAVFDAPSDEAQPDEARAAPEPASETAPNVLPVAAPYIPKATQQAARILEVIRALGYHPLALPTRDKGKPGIRSQVRAICMQQSDLFTASSFKHAWEDLREEKSIQGGE